MLSTLNSHARDADICFFEEDHHYEVKGCNTYTSVTTVVHHLFPGFDAIVMATKMVSNPKFPSAYRYKKYRKIVEGLDKKQSINALIKEWDRNRDECASLGTLMHANIEKYYNDMNPVDDSKEFQFFKNYAQIQQDNNLIPYRTEWVIYDTVSHIAGSIDMLYTKGLVCNGKKILTMVDWKRSKKINKKSFFSDGLGCMSLESDCNFVHYSLQLNMYKYILEKNYDVIIDKMYIVVFHPDNKSFLEYEVPDRQDDIANIVWDHKRTIMSESRDV